MQHLDLHTPILPRNSRRLATPHLLDQHALAEPGNVAAREYVTDDLGYSQAPVVVVDDHDHWSGFQPAKIRELAARIGATDE
ncbi:glutaredoxin family protein [Microbacterium sediminis]|uniref:glutaredoxin family protein n=1 Tax=Microbacterium sediminis TaxID=904291 RepID=UPI001072D4E0|nr:glutaredoxin family protein [Microbacterium sediminis]QBR73330.1 glutaredoxin family protein [Microbacterium sediminis]